jgi:hypothetical protein
MAHAQQGGLSPKPTKADAQNVVQIIPSDEMKTQAYCDLNKLARWKKNEALVGMAAEEAHRPLKTLNRAWGPGAITYLTYTLADGVEPIAEQTRGAPDRGQLAKKAARAAVTPPLS